MNSEWGDDDQPGKVDLNLWRQLLDYTLHYRRTTIAFTVVAIGLAMSDLGFPLLAGQIITDIETNGTKIDFVWYSCGFAFLTVSLSSCVWGFIYCAGIIRTHVSHDIRRDAFVKLQHLSFSFYDTKPIGWLMARLTADCQRLSQILAWGVMDLIWGSVLILGITVAMLWQNWKLALAVLAVIPVMGFVSVYFRKLILTTSRLVRKTNSKITGAYNECITGVRTTKTFVRQDENLADFDRLAEEMYTHSVRNMIYSAVYLPVILTLGSVAMALALAIGGYDVILGTLVIGEVVMFLYFAELFFGPIQDLSAWFAEMQMAQASAERVLSLVNAVPEIQDSEQVVQLLKDQGHDRFADEIQRIELRNVQFQYRDGPTAIDGISLTVQAGETIALVGPTGGGKSTLVNLLCRFYEPTSGEILVNDLEYRERSLASWQANLGIVLQQPHLFSGSIAENIRYGKLDATDEEVQAAAELVCAHDFIDSLPNGYDTEVGEGGGQLSLGQKQLVSFARAIIKQPNILVMDEATSSIDTETETLIQTGIKRVLKGRTSFVIAHRLSTIRSADRILVIEQGRIVEQGSHSELLKLGGKYQNLYANQSMSESTNTSEAFN